MAARAKNIEGFTLSELLLSVAIILVLAAIAIPSIVTAQNNMRMVELNNAAESLANAAQTQMTAKKVSGTWLALIEKGGSGTDAHEVKFPNASNVPSGANAADTYYMTADEARKTGIVPSLSIDDQVRGGDYVIEFAASTASVVSVFYTDGKAGFFGSAPENGTTAARTYYNEGKGARDQASRMSASPMIGYYQGTPAGATDAVALQNPVIWVDELGHLCVQNSNVSMNTQTATRTEIVISTQGEGPKSTIVISGLDSGAGSYVISSGDISEGYSNTDEATAIFELLPRDDLSDADVFVIDLNDLSNVLDGSATAAGQSLANVVKAIATSGVSLLVEASVSPSDPQTPSVPATAEAYIQWPEKVATLSVFVTNPALDAKENGGKSPASHIGGTYEEPQTELVTDSGDEPVTGLKMKEQQVVFELSEAGIVTHDLLAAENIESTRQSYSGGWVKLSDAKDQANPEEGVNVYASVKAGSYTSDAKSVVDVSKMKNPTTGAVLWSRGGSFAPSGSTHQYQVYEVWINGERAGYLRQGNWVWEETELASLFSQCVDPITSGSSEVKINLSKLYDLVPQDADGYEVYVRTTPKASEVKKYFSDNMSRIKDYMRGGRTTGMRGVNLGAPIRQPFENEFGASSTVSLYNITSAAPTDTYASESVVSDNSSYFVQNDVRVYYSATSALAWKDKSSTPSVCTEVPSAQLWGYRQSDRYADTLPEAYVVSARGSVPNYSLTGTTSADFELSAARDGLFYRVIEYCDEKGDRLNDTSLQFVPYAVQDDSTYATIASREAKEGYRFSWLVDNGSTWPSDKPFAIHLNEKGVVVGNFDSALKYGRVKLKENYEEIPKGAGLVYLEFGKETLGYSGYLGVGQPLSSSLVSNEEAIESWGYYVVVPASEDDKGKAPALTGSANSLITLDAKNHILVTIDGTSYRAYKLNSKNQDGLIARQIEVNLKYNQVDATYYCNLNFAGAISDQLTVAGEWGKSETTAWNVRHADQFPGCLSTGWAVKVTQAYSNDCFLQSHDLDMAQRTGTAPIFRDTIFGGTYDGGKYEISNVHVNAEGLVRSNAPNQTRGASLLFLKVAGPVVDGQQRRACLKNIRIKEDPKQFEDGVFEWEMKENDSQTYFGILAGAISDCDVVDCDISGASSDKESFTTIEIEHNTSDVYGWGVLIGMAENSLIRESDVNGIGFVAKDTEKNAWGKRGVSYGGIVGYAISTDLDTCTVVDSSVGTTVPAEGKAVLAGGGLVGAYEGDLGLKKCQVARVSLVYPDAEDKGGNVYAPGVLVGAQGSSGVVSEDCLSSDVWVLQDDQRIPIDKFIEQSSGNSVQSTPVLENVDARKEQDDPLASEAESVGNPEEAAEQRPATTTGTQEGGKAPADQGNGEAS